MALKAAQQHLVFSGEPGYAGNPAAHATALQGDVLWPAAASQPHHRQNLAAFLHTPLQPQVDFSQTPVDLPHTPVHAPLHLRDLPPAFQPHVASAFTQLFGGGTSGGMPGGMPGVVQGLQGAMKGAQKAVGYVPPPPKDYGGELQIVEDHRSESILFSDLTDNWNFTCWEKGPVKRAPTPLEEPPAETGFKPKWPSMPVPQMFAPRHPQLEFNYPHRKVHVHLEDRSAEYPSGRVLWDADYDMGGTETLKGRAKPLGGEQQEFQYLCPPLKGPAHWYELTVTRRPPKGDDIRRNPHHAVEDFIGSQIVTTYRPDQDPEMLLFGEQAKEEGGGGCTVM